MKDLHDIIAAAWACVTAHAGTSARVARQLESAVFYGEDSQWVILVSFGAPPASINRYTMEVTLDTRTGRVLGLARQERLDGRISYHDVDMEDAPR